MIFFAEKEGTNPLVRLLNNFDQLSVVHQINGRGWEPFDVHNCGPVSFESLEHYFNLIYGHKYIDMVRLNEVYTQKAKRPLEVIDPTKIIAFKMRFRPAKYGSPTIRKLPLIRRFVNPIIKRQQLRTFKRAMFELLKKYQIITFVAVRQDVFRWALSKYHGDGSGRSGNLQFKVADGSLKKSELEKIYVSCDRLEKIILSCEQKLQSKKELMNELKRENIPVYPLLYENFCQDKTKYFEELFNRINFSISREEIEDTIQAGSYFKKVHSDDISNFVQNHEEVLARFGDRFDDWS
jgi:hypothetical protein